MPQMQWRLMKFETELVPGMITTSTYRVALAKNFERNLGKKILFCFRNQRNIERRFYFLHFFYFFNELRNLKNGVLVSYLNLDMCN